MEWKIFLKINVDLLDVFTIMKEEGIEEHIVGIFINKKSREGK